MTAAGRAIGIVLMIAGVGVFGVVAASAAAWFISDGQEQHSHQQEQTITALTTEVAALRREISELSERIAAQPGAPAGPVPQHRRMKTGNRSTTGIAAHRAVPAHARQPVTGSTRREPSRSVRPGNTEPGP